MHKLLPIAACALALAAFQLSPSTSSISVTDTTTLPDPNTTDETPQDNKLVIYQLLPRLFGNKKTVNKPYGTSAENGTGKFNDITAPALQAIRDMGVSHVWYTGVIEHATMSDFTKFGIPLDDADVVKGRAGSPYAIKDYYDVDPDLAVDVKNRMKEFEALVKRTHDNKLKLIIDFIPNHVARTYKSDAKPAGVVDLGEKDDKTKGFAPRTTSITCPANPWSCRLPTTRWAQQQGQKKIRSLRRTRPKSPATTCFRPRPASMTGSRPSSSTTASITRMSVRSTSSPYPIRGRRCATS
ncbi:alpha-amylase family glycosyl hydrolase [Hymenobacter qilianensis]|uniref:alpha-amylase family glycosyl hydrolase n=1 Tax=Hymenobacter qilianensis TaxID=1385715 RepID=UPI00293BD9BD|nr:alpha-amylase family glycosyl hydrolase [Hymenobacter qilianensis]